jgi:hypothetical protein
MPCSSLAAISEAEGCMRFVEEKLSSFGTGLSLEISLDSMNYCFEIGVFCYVALGGGFRRRCRDPMS